MGTLRHVRRDVYVDLAETPVENRQFTMAEEDGEVFEIDVAGGIDGDEGIGGGERTEAEICCALCTGDAGTSAAGGKMLQIQHGENVDARAQRVCMTHRRRNQV